MLLLELFLQVGPKPSVGQIVVLFELVAAFTIAGVCLYRLSALYFLDPISFLGSSFFHVSWQILFILWLPQRALRPSS